MYIEILPDESVWSGDGVYIEILPDESVWSGDGVYVGLLAVVHEGVRLPDPGQHLNRQGQSVLDR